MTAAEGTLSATRHRQSPRVPAGVPGWQRVDTQLSNRTGEGPTDASVMTRLHQAVSMNRARSLQRATRRGTDIALFDPLGPGSTNAGRSATVQGSAPQEPVDGRLSPDATAKSLAAFLLVKATTFG